MTDQSVPNADASKVYDEGSVTAFTVTVVGALIALLGLVTDGGLALAARVKAVGEAQEAARAGARHLDLDSLRTNHIIDLGPDAAQQAAADYLAAAGATGRATATPDEVTVTVERTQRTQLLSLVGISSLHVTATATAHPAWRDATP